MTDKTWYFVNESDAKSIWSDVFSFGLLFSGFYINYKFIGNSMVLQIILAFCILVMSYSRAQKGVKRMTRQEAKEYLCGGKDGSSSERERHSKWEPVE